ncbi:MAG: putative nucleic-acid-binding protein [Bradyrhizobium sp.]|nr:putative nucleic-acid-binding protein [Bradyrhizobium sp.]
MPDAVTENVRPLAPFIGLDADDHPYLQGVKCAACGETLAIEVRRACPRCATIGALEPVQLAEQGKLYTYTVVHRSFPGVKVPFVAALVDLDGGGSIKGNLVGVELDAIRFDMPLRVAFENFAAPGAGGERHIRHVFQPIAG